MPSLVWITNGVTLYGYEATPAQQREAQRLYDLRAMTMEQIAAAVGSSPSTVYRYLSADGRRSVDR